MGRWLAAIRLDVAHQAAKALPNEVLGVLGVSDLSVSEKFSDAFKEGFGGFGGSPSGAFAKNSFNPSLQDLQDSYEERAAIIEYDGGFPRAEAEAMAWEQVFGVHRPKA
jgi:hypothetical protein